MSRSIELEIEVPGTPEEVWETIATGPGITSWFTPMTVEERAGGEVVTDFGDYGTDTATVTAWEPPRRVQFSGTGERALAYEWLVEARDGGTCIVRLVNSGFGDGEDWDADFDGMTEGWGIFLEHLRLQRTYFPRHRAVATSIPTAMLPGPNDRAWNEICDALGVPDTLAGGDRIEAGADTPGLSGTVASVMRTDAASTVLFLLDDRAGSGFLTVEGDGEQVAASLYLYFYDERAAAVGPSWKDWLTTRYRPVTT